MAVMLLKSSDFTTKPFFSQSGCQFQVLDVYLPIKTSFREEDDMHVSSLLSTNGKFFLPDKPKPIRRNERESIVLSLLWHKSIPRRISSFVWKLLNNLLPVDAQLKTNGICLASKCQCCDKEESVEHVFIDNEKTRTVWRHFGEIFNLHQVQVSSVTMLLMGWFNSAGKYSCKGHIRIIIPMVVLWFIWLERNEAKHHGAEFTIGNIIWGIQQLISQLDQAGLLDANQWRGDECHRASLFCCPILFGRCPSYTIVRWLKPEIGRLKLNVDGSVHPNDKKAGGGVIRDWEGNFVAGFAEHYDGNISVVKAEVQALVRGLEFCSECGIQNIWVEMDSLIVVKLVLGSSFGSSDVCCEIDEAQNLLRTLNGRISHIFREGNSVADYFENYGVDNAGLKVFGSASQNGKLERLLESDKMGLPYLCELSWKV